MIIAIPATAACQSLVSRGYFIFFQSEKRGGRPTNWLPGTLLILLDEKGHKPFILCGAHKTFNTLEAEVSAGKNMISMGYIS